MNAFEWIPMILEDVDEVYVHVTVHIVVPDCYVSVQ